MANMVKGVSWLILQIETGTLVDGYMGDEAHGQWGT